MKRVLGPGAKGELYEPPVDPVTDEAVEIVVDPAGEDDTIEEDEK